MHKFNRKWLYRVFCPLDGYQIVSAFIDPTVCPANPEHVLTTPPEIISRYADDWQSSAKSKTISDPPESPTPEQNDCYIVGPSATGDWATFEDNIAMWENDGWTFSVPTAGCTCWIEDQGRHFVYNSTAWVMLNTIPSAHFDAYLTTESIVGSSWVDMPLDVQRVIDSDFTHTTGEADVTINTTGRYQIMCRCTTYLYSGSSRSGSAVKLQRDTGSGYSDISGSLGHMYHRNSSSGKDTCNVTLIMDLDAGDKIKARAKRDSGNGALKFFDEGCGLTITLVG